MAKLSKGRALVRSDVRRIRDRHLQALRAGYSKEEAAAFANGDEPLRKKVKAKPVEEPRHEDGVTKVRDVLPQRSSISGRVRLEEIESDVKEEQKEQPKEVNSKIPKDWQELPWPQLKTLAENVSGAEVKSRKHANEVIDSVLSGK